MIRDSAFNRPVTFISLLILIAGADQTTSESTHNYIENMLEVLDTGKAMRPCCRCPADESILKPEEMAESQLETEPVKGVVPDSLVEQYPSVLQKRFVSPKLDVPNIYRLGFFWKSRMCCECGVDDDSVKLAERRGNLNRV